MCNIEFPHFGASYPDAHCIGGYLWDMDSYEDGCYTSGGVTPHAHSAIRRNGLKMLLVPCLIQRKKPLYGWEKCVLNMVTKNKR